MSSLPRQSFFDHSYGRKRTDSVRSENGVDNIPPRERHSSFSDFLTKSTSVNDALKRDSKYLTDGDGYEKEKYVKTVTPAEPQESGEDKKKVDLESEMLRQNRVLHNEDGFEKSDYVRKT